MYKGWFIAGVGLLALAVGLGLGLWRIAPGGSELNTEQIYATRYADLQGQSQALRNWRGKILVLNFWATWCPPCREEIPDFVQVDTAYRGKNVAIVGIALDGQEAVQDFAREFGIHYPLLLGGAEAYDFAARLGNTSKGIPFTVILDPQGKISYLGVGAVRKQELEKVLDKLLAGLPARV